MCTVHSMSGVDSDTCEWTIERDATSLNVSRPPASLSRSGGGFEGR